MESLESSSLVESAERLLELMFGPLLAQMPPAAMVGLAALLLSLTLWVAWRALRDLLAVRAVYGTPETRQQSAFSASRVKVRGLARAAPLQKDPGPGQVIWQESKRYSGGGFRSGTETYGDLLIESGDVLYAVRSQDALLVPTESSEEHAFLDRSTFSITRTIRSGDALWAIGRPERGAIADSGEARKTFRLRRSAGVLLVSGRPEREVMVIYGLWLPIHAAIALACCCLLAWAVQRHLYTYPPCAGGQLRTFVQTLVAAPFTAEPGVNHPDWGNTPSTGTSCASEEGPH